MRVELTDIQRRQILRGDYPHLPLEPDEAKALEPHRIEIIEHRVWIDVLAARKDKKTGWYAEYRVSDNRPRFMKRTEGYTQSVSLAVANEDEEAIPPEYQKELTLQANRNQAEFDRVHRAEDLARQDVQRLTSEMRELTKRAVKMGVDPAVALAPIMRAVAEQHRSLHSLKDAA